ncbi:MAG: sigma-70 family RNA polymerase sigma factor [Planctomycetota bacterium]
MGKTHRNYGDEQPLENEAAVRAIIAKLVSDRDDFDDLLQNVRLVALKNTDVEIHDRPAWEKGVARNVCYGHNYKQSEERWRAEGHFGAVGLDGALSQVDPPDLKLQREEVSQRLIEAIGRLREPEAYVIWARYFGGQTFEQVASDLGRKVSTVRSDESRARKKLQGMIDREDFLGLNWGVLVALAVLDRVEAGSLLGHRAPRPRAFRVKLYAALAAGAAAGVAAIALWPSDPSGRRLEGPVGDVASVDAPPLDPLAVHLSAEPSRLEAEESRTPVEAAFIETESGSFVAIQGRVTVGKSFFDGLDACRDVTLHYEIYEGLDRSSPPFRSGAIPAPSGEFLIEGLPFRPDVVWSILVRPEKEGALGREDWVVIPGDQPTPKEVSVPLFPVDMRLTILVVDPDGYPVAGARVLHEGVELVTDAAGRASLETSSLLEGRRIVVLAEGFAYAVGRVPGPEADLEDPLRIDLLPEVRVRGFVGMPGVAVRDQGDWWAHNVAYSDETGWFELGGLSGEPGRNLLFSKEGYVDKIVSVDDLLSGPSVPAVHLEPGVTVHGRVLTSSGRPVPAALIQTDKLKVYSDGLGYFTLQGLAEGSLELRVSRSGLAPSHQTIEVAAGGRALGIRTIELSPGRTVRGYVVDEHMRPVPNARVGLSNGAVRWTELAVSTDDQGRFTLEGVPIHGVDLEVEAPGLITRRVRVDDLASAEETFVLKR